MESWLWPWFCMTPTFVWQHRNYNVGYITNWCTTDGSTGRFQQLLDFYSLYIHCNFRNAVLMISVRTIRTATSLLMDKCNSATQESNWGFSLCLLWEKWIGGKEMLKVTPKQGLGKRQAKPQCLTNRQQIELHTACSESTLCNLSWALCLHLPHTHS